MVQVDIFWSYGLNAGLALAAHKTLSQEKTFWKNPYFTLSLLWTALLFAPSGMYLLWSFPGWETMFVAQNHLSIPAWLVCLFGVTNISQGILGFYVTWRFLKSGNFKAARLQTIWSHAAMLYVLVFGWDFQGYKRFLYAGTGDDWHTGISYPLTAWFTSPVFFTLLGMGLFFIPSYIYLIKKFQKQSL